MTASRPGRPSVAVEEARFRGEPALRLRSGPTVLVVLPGLGLTGVSLRHDDGEYLALPGGLDALREGRTSGLPLLAPWGNRISAPRYRVGRVAVDLRPALRSGAVRTDGNGLPIHGLLAGRSVWTVLGSGERAGAAWLRASIDVDVPAFPFPHLVEVLLAVRAGSVRVDTTVVATGRRRVPVAFGWHPYLRVPGTPRDRLRLVVPRMTHLGLDELGIPDGSHAVEAASGAVIGRRRFDDLYALGERGRALSLLGEDGRGVTVRCGSGYRFAQVWVPQGRPFASLEPMVAPTDALTTGEHPTVAPGEQYTARFAMDLT